MLEEVSKKIHRHPRCATEGELVSDTMLGMRKTVDHASCHMDDSVKRPVPLPSAQLGARGKRTIRLASMHNFLTILGEILKPSINLRQLSVFKNGIEFRMSRKLADFVH